ncbi:hypothetical protein DNTS_004683 [Danionella cerebrum]|uniref:Uncharacterized protein n=1 Tax=Danionella cerebrum TaxID=2873325 RepID=A0A553QZ51_9TELE|nr:hypothetical protein DNTS_004683 [Danionella translucida]
MKIRWSESTSAEQAGEKRRAGEAHAIRFMRQTLILEPIPNSKPRKRAEPEKCAPRGNELGLNRVRSPRHGSERSEFVKTGRLQGLQNWFDMAMRPGAENDWALKPFIKAVIDGQQKGKSVVTSQNALRASVLEVSSQGESMLKSWMLWELQWSPVAELKIRDQTYGMKKSSGCSSSTYLNFSSGNFCSTQAHTLLTPSSSDEYSSPVSLITPGLLKPLRTLEDHQ